MRGMTECSAAHPVQPYLSPSSALKLPGTPQHEHAIEQVECIVMAVLVLHRERGDNANPCRECSLMLGLQTKIGHQSAARRQQRSHGCSLLNSSLLRRQMDTMLDCSLEARVMRAKTRMRAINIRAPVVDLVLDSKHRTALKRDQGTSHKNACGHLAMHTREHVAIGNR